MNKMFLQIFSFLGILTNLQAILLCSYKLANFLASREKIKFVLVHCAAHCTHVFFTH
jgi:hypothetical protein